MIIQHHASHDQRSHGNWVTAGNNSINKIVVNSLSDYKFKSQNLEKFGKDGDNILFITGISGSGKSTAALRLGKKINAEVVHLDYLYDNKASSSEKNNSKFMQYLKQNGINVEDVIKNGKVNYEESDKIYPILKEYSKTHKVIAEGVQIKDQTMHEDMPNIIKNQPLIILQTNAKLSRERAKERDSKQ